MYSEAYKQVKDTSSAGLLWRRLARAVPIAFGITLVIFVVCALLLTYTGLPEEAIPAIAIVTAVISVVSGGVIASKGVSGKGYLTGAAVGIFYVLLLYIFSCLFAGDMFFNSYILILLAIGLFGGAFGGILGINLSTGKKRY